MEAQQTTSQAAGPVARRLSRLRSAWVLVGAVCLVVVGIAALSQLVPGQRASEDFFVVCATVGPLFGLALSVEIPLVMAPVIEKQGQSDANKATVRALVRINVAMLIIAESAALYAVGWRSRSAFLASCSVLPWLIQLVLLVQTAYYRTGVSNVGPG
jgi:hypothetical protein